MFNPLWKCVGTEEWQGRLVVVERHRLRGCYRRRCTECCSLHEVA